MFDWPVYIYQTQNVPNEGYKEPRFQLCNFALFTNKTEKGATLDHPSGHILLWGNRGESRATFTSLSNEQWSTARACLNPHTLAAASTNIFLIATQSLPQRKLEIKNKTANVRTFTGIF